MLDLIGNHSFALTRRQGEWTVVENASLKASKDELKRLNDHLDELVRSRTSDLRTALQARDAFLSLVSHELKTPVTTLRLYVGDLLRANERTLPQAELAKKIDKIRKQLAHIELLSARLLECADIDNPEPRLDRSRIHLNALVHGIIDRMESLASQEGCRVRIHDEEQVAGHWDATRIDHAISNILLNAFKHAPGGTVDVTIGRNGERALVSIKDAGAGISPEDQRHIFDKFTRVSPGSRASGLGLGLWTARRIANEHGGSVFVESAPRQGSTFTLSLPIAESSSSFQPPQRGWVP